MVGTAAGFRRVAVGIIRYPIGGAEAPRLDSIGNSCYPLVECKIRNQNGRHGHFCGYRRYREESKEWVLWNYCFIAEVGDDIPVPSSK